MVTLVVDIAIKAFYLIQKVLAYLEKYLYLVSCFIVLGVGAYFVIQSFLKPRIETKESKLINILIWASALFFPGFILDMIKYQISLAQIIPFDFITVYYLFFCIISLHYIFKNEFRNIYTDPSVFINKKCEKFGITDREREIILQIINGETNKQVADKLFVVESTVKQHLKNIFRKTSVINRGSLIVLFTRK